MSDYFHERDEYGLDLTRGLNNFLRGNLTDELLVWQVCSAANFLSKHSLLIAELLNYK